MLRNAVEVRPLPDFHLWIKFNDGVSGEVDTKNIISFKGVFAALKDEKEFAKVFIHPEFSVVCWPNGADLDNEVLYSFVTGKPITLDDGTTVHSSREAAHV